MVKLSFNLQGHFVRKTKVICFEYYLVSMVIYYISCHPLIDRDTYHKFMFRNLVPICPTPSHGSDGQQLVNSAWGDLHQTTVVCPSFLPFLLLADCLLQAVAQKCTIHFSHYDHRLLCYLKFSHQPQARKPVSDKIQSSLQHRKPRPRNRYHRIHTIWRYILKTYFCSLNSDEI